ncbi:MAG TPA: TIGR02996 domain-containing protein [Gemmataceae bacterium]|nr:TIGR02996 domain-containing protein [Gemmataceae bacterium]
MTDHDTFLKTIIDRPDDDTARLVFADWLAENGDPDRGEFIRIEVELARRDPDGFDDEPRRSDLFARRSELLKQHGKRWLAPFQSYAKESGFERGFVHELEVPVEVFLTRGEEWFAAAPITRVRFARFEVWVDTIRQGLWLADALFGSPLLSRLAVINLERNQMNASDMEWFARHPDLSRLRELKLEWNLIRTEGAIVLAGMAQLRGLESLDLMNNGITDRGARAIAESPHLAGLKELRITRNPIRKTTWALLEDRFGLALM